MGKSQQHILQLAKQTLEIEANSLLSGIQNLNENFADCIEAIIQSKGRIIVTGIGKSAIIAQKMVATFNSTGSPAIYMHAADAIHGDLGIIQTDDIIICLSHSGNTPEIKVLVPLLKRAQNKLIAITGNINSFLASNADFVLDATIQKEACPNNLAPTASTTLQLALGDALAVCLLDYKEFKAADFAKYHPGGALGKKLYLRVSDLIARHPLATVTAEENISQVISEITKSRVGAVVVVDTKKLLGVITDGDIRRMLQDKKDFMTLHAKDIMNAHPKSIEKEAMAVDAFNLMKTFKIAQLVIKEGDTAVGIIHIQDLIEEGII
jgi:arabinose-5-phosphate isomerase